MVPRIAKVFNCFIEHGPEIGLNEMIVLTGLSKGTIYRLLTDLKTQGYIEQNNENQKYRLGVAFIELGNYVLNQIDVNTIAPPYLKKLCEETGETVHLGIYDQGYVLYIAKVDSPNPVKINSWIGKRTPAYCTGIGKVLLAFNEERLVHITDMEQFTANTIVDKHEFESALVHVKKEGFARDDEEFDEGVNCIAAPIFDNQGEVDVVISVSGPVQRMNEEKMNDILPLLLASARDISKQMGYTGKVFS